MHQPAKTTTTMMMMKTTTMMMKGKKLMAVNKAQTMMRTMTMMRMSNKSNQKFRVGVLYVDILSDLSSRNSTCLMWREMIPLLLPPLLPP